MTRRVLVILGLGLVLGLGLFSCSSHSDPWEKAGNRVKVVVTFAPLASFVEKVGGDRVAVVCLTTTTGPHHFDPRTWEAVAVSGADLFIANGLGLDDHFAKKLYKTAAKKDLPFIELGEELETLNEKSKTSLLIPAEKVAGEKGKHDHGDGHQHGEGEWDPHVWLGFASTVPPMIDVICEKLQKADPSHKDEFEKNATNFKKELVELGSDAKKALADKKDKRLITFHDSLRYFARDLRDQGLEIVATVHVDPGDTVTSAHYKKLISLCKDKGVKYIAVEPQYESSEAKKIVSELEAKDVKGIKILKIDPLETADKASELNGDWYVEKMKQNLKELKDKLE